MFFEFRFIDGEKLVITFILKQKPPQILKEKINSFARKCEAQIKKSAESNFPTLSINNLAKNVLGHDLIDNFESFQMTFS